MIIVNAASEINPYMKTGGLADVTGSMPLEMRQNNKVLLFMPLYKKVQEDYSPDYYCDFPCDFSTGIKTVIVKKKDLYKNVTIYFIGEHSYFFRDVIYGDYEDNSERFSFFSKAILTFIKNEKIEPDVIHSHDWQTGLIPLFGKRDPYFKNTVFGFTIHNLSYQGVFPFSKIFSTGLDESYFTSEKMEFYGNASTLKAGIVYSDFINTVSPSYRDETLTEEYGCGMQGLLSYRSDDYYGIINGIDYKEWDPSKDKNLFKNYDINKIQDKYINKYKVMDLYFEKYDKEKALFVCVTRLASQKGIELIIDNIENIVKKGHYVIILGSGEKKYELMLKEIENKFSANFKVVLKYDFAFSHQLYAAGDFFLMPSQFEPCGLSQMISLRYGNIPIVRKTGGLNDTIDRFDVSTKEGNGFVFESFNADSMKVEINRALKIYNQKDLWKEFIKKGMKIDFSWKNTAKKYLELYKKYKRK